MTVKLSRLAPVFGALVWLASASTASAQWYPFRGLFTGNPCGPSTSMYAPNVLRSAYVPTAMYNNPCVCAPAMVAHPVTETVMRQMPVTEYHQMRQTVRKPVVETTYIDQPVTEYRQVIEQKTVSVPTVAYQDVTECQTVQKNVGQWVTKWHSNQKIPVCQYDNRPGFMGEMNRIGHATRQALIPAQYATREYQSQVIAQQIPVTRRVAVQGSKQVTYNVARAVPTQTTRKVAVNTVKYVDEEVMVMQPVTVVKSVPTTRTTYRFVPAGSAMASGPGVNNTALLPTPDPVNNANSIPKKQSATRDDDKSRSSDSRANELPAKGAFQERSSSADEDYDDSHRRVHSDDAPKTPIRFVASKAPDSVRIGGWRPTSTANASKPMDWSQRATPAMTVAENH